MLGPTEKLLLTHQLVLGLDCSLLASAPLLLLSLLLLGLLGLHTLTVPSDVPTSSCGALQHKHTQTQRQVMHLCCDISWCFTQHLRCHSPLKHAVEGLGHAVH